MLLQGVFEDILKRGVAHATSCPEVSDTLDLDSLINVAKQTLKPSVGTVSSCPCDVREMETYVVVYVDLPGVDKNTVDLTVDERDFLTIRVNRKLYSESSDVFHLKERYEGVIEKKVKLPKNLDKTSQIKGFYQDGVLKVQIQKQVATQSSVKIHIS